MRFLGVGEWNNLGDMYLRLLEAGHEVRVCIEEPEAREIMRGMIPQTADWRKELDWVKAAGRDGIILFESTHHGTEQDRLRREGFQVIGGSAYGDRLENDRAFGQAILRKVGMQTAPVHAFQDFAAAMDFIRAHPGRYVFKNNGGTSPSSENYVGELEDGSDVLSLLEFHRMQAGPEGKPDFVLMRHITGVEVGAGAYFDGRRFLAPALLDWEHKRFFPEDMGELTGEMGTVVTYRGAERIFGLTLARMEAELREAGHCGYVNLNTIINAEGVWPLEFTCRFGYPGFAICDSLHLEGWAGLFRKLADGAGGTIPTRDGFAVGVVLTVPPFPHEYGYSRLSKGMPIFFSPDVDGTDRKHFHFGEVALMGSQLVTSGFIGYVLVATGIGDSVESAREAAYGRIAKVVVANRRYRTDIGTRLARRDLAELRRLGYYP